MIEPETATGERGMGTRLRVRYRKTGKIRFTGHRDVVRMWERGLRRSGLPVAWSEGFSPRPLISFGLALPTGAESFAEYLDVVLDPPVAVSDPDALCGLLTGVLPEGLDVDACGWLGAATESLQQEVSSCSWELEVLGLAAEELARRVEQLLAAPSVLVRRERKGRTAVDDLRPAVLALSVATTPTSGRLAPSDGPIQLNAELATRPRGVRPRELLQGLGSDLELVRARRIHQWIERDGVQREPLSGDRPVAHVANASGAAP